MPIFNFNIVKKKQKTESIKDLNNDYTIIEQNVSGVVYITPDFSYYVVIKGVSYNFTSNSFSCKNKRIIYAQFLDENNQRLRYIRPSHNKSECNPLYFLPFAAGSIVYGNIVHNKFLNQNLFRFKKVIIEYMHPDSHDAIESWRTNKEEIASIRNSRIIKFNNE